MNTERIKVLYVDDEEGNLLAFRAGFRREFDVTTAKSGSEALELLERESPHVVVSDQRMPHMTGTEFLARSVSAGRGSCASCSPASRIWNPWWTQ